MHSPAELLSLYETKFNTNNFNENPTSLYEPVNHIMKMKGKRIRPLLVLMAVELFDGNVEHALNPAFAMEVFHNFTLVHDDIMDHADIRRGEPTVHKKYGINAGILAGDVMLAYAYKYLTSIPNDKIPSLLNLFNKTAIEIFEGQQMDVDFENKEDVTEEAYLKMIEYKTSVLLACCLQCGAILSGASEKNQDLIYNFGLKLGLAFQIKDDYLDAFGEAEKVGKRIGGDILLNKKTLLLITALQTAKGEKLVELKNLLFEVDEDKKIKGIKNLFVSLGVQKIVEDRIEGFFNQSLESLNAIDLPHEKKQVLLTFAKQIHEREF